MPQPRRAAQNYSTCICALQGSDSTPGSDALCTTAASSQLSHFTRPSDLRPETTSPCAWKCKETGSVRLKPARNSLEASHAVTHAPRATRTQTTSCPEQLLHGQKRGNISVLFMHNINLVRGCHQSPRYEGAVSVGIPLEIMLPRPLQHTLRFENPLTLGVNELQSLRPLSAREGGRFQIVVSTPGLSVGCWPAAPLQAHLESNVTRIAA
jgi:hypothetical protein